MKQVTRRTLLVLLPVAILALGVVFFLAEYVVHGAAWAAFSANDTTHAQGRLTAGQILDRSGQVLYDAESGSYAEDWITRIATLHAVGDGSGNIGTAARSQYANRMVGFGPIIGAHGKGNKLYLTLDTEVCETAYSLLAGHKGVVGVYNYETGDVLCMVSAPSFDPAWPPEIRDGDSAYEGVYLNRLLSATFTPGSVFKTVTTAAALEKLDGITERTFTCEGSYRIGDDVITCPHVHGQQTLRDAFANSCNCVYAALAMELGGRTLRTYAGKAGLLSSMDISGVATAVGSFTVGESYELGWSGVGQYNDLVNPCAMMVMMGAIARDGTPVLPRVLYRETGLLGLPHIVPAALTGSAAFRRDTCRTLREMLRNNVEAGYGQSHFGDLTICAKSGTAEVAPGKAPHAWFNGFLDDPNHPLAFVVLVENGGSGATVAGNIASQVLQKAVERMDGN